LANKLVIADTSCLIILNKIGYLDILNRLFIEVQITSKVAEEFGESLPKWIEVKDPIDKNRIKELSRMLDAGEATSIALALERNSVTLIIDEKKGRKVAVSFNLDVIGTLGVLLLAKQRGIINDLNAVFNKLEVHGFRYSPSLKKTILNLANEH